MRRSTVHPHRYIARLRHLVETGRYAEALTYASDSSEEMRGQMDKHQLGTLSALMEHANLGASVRPCDRCGQVGKHCWCDGEWSNARAELAT